MTDNEIIKVLNNELKCVKRQFGGMCDNKRDCGKCDLALPDKEVISAYESVLDLINRQKAEIERLNAKIKAKDEINYYNMGQLKVARDDIKTVKSEAIKEFAQRLKCKIWYRPECQYVGSITPDYIDNLVKEMMEKKMSEKKYVDADLLKSELKALLEQERFEYMGVYDCINSTPDADVAEVQHGEWKNKLIATNGVAEMKSVCSLCNKPNKQYQPPYCPHCGAKMDKERQ